MVEAATFDPFDAFLINWKALEKIYNKLHKISTLLGP